VTNLPDFSFEFRGKRWGLRLPVATDADGFDLGDADGDFGGQRMPRDSAFAFGGNDRYAPGSWSWDVHTHRARDPQTALADLAALLDTWNAAADTYQRGDVDELTYKIAGRERVVFGRARHAPPILPQSFVTGVAKSTLTFDRADLLYYGEKRAINVGLAPAVPVGFKSPFTTPMTSLAGSGRVGSLDAAGVGGDRPTPFVAVITAGGQPVLNPSLRGDGWRIDFDHLLPAGKSITINTYPWAYSARRENGASLHGSMKNTMLSKARLKPTGESLFFDGVDSSGTATCQVTWRPANTSI